MDWKGARDQTQARLAERIREILLERGRMSAKEIASMLSEDTGQAKVHRHWANSVLYKRRDWFRQVPGPFWRPPQWEAMPSESSVAEPVTVLEPLSIGEPIPIGMIEPIRDEATVAEVEAEPTAEELALRRERERRRAAVAASPTAAQSNKGVHISSPTFGLSDDFHDWAQGEKTKYTDQDAG